MTGEGVGRLFSNSMLDGPFPEHYEPVEAPIENPLHPKQSESPVAFLYDKQGGRENRFGTVEDYPYIATSYRLTEHEHYVTQHVPPWSVCSRAVRRGARGGGEREGHPERRPRPREERAWQARGAAG